MTCAESKSSASIATRPSASPSFASPFAAGKIKNNAPSISPGLRPGSPVHPNPIPFKFLKLIAKLSNGSRWQISCSMIYHSTPAFRQAPRIPAQFIFPSPTSAMSCLPSAPIAMSFR